MTWPRRLSRLTRGRVNALALRLAGRAWFADVEHVGRRSGTVRHTPVRGFRVGETVVIGANFGVESDWVKNVRAAGGCRIRLGTQLLDCGPPRLVPVDEGIRGMPRLFGLALKHVVGTKECLELPVLKAGPVRPGPTP